MVEVATSQLNDSNDDHVMTFSRSRDLPNFADSAKKHVNSSTENLYPAVPHCSSLDTVISFLNDLFIFNYFKKTIQTFIYLFEN